MNTMRNVLLISVVVLIFTACPSPMQQEEATLTLHFGAIEARAVYPPDAETLAKLEHTITLVGPGETITRTFEPGVTSANIEIVTGTWTITVEAFLVEGTTKELYAVGENTVNVEAGENKVTVTMKYANDDNSKDFNFELITSGPNIGTARVWPKSTPSGSIVIPGYYYDGTSYYTVTEIGNEAFFYCNSLTAITIPASVTTIGNQAFYGCASLEIISFAEDSRLKSIGIEAFADCRILTTITIPEGVTLIDNCAFSDCRSLTAITIPASVEAIGWEAFSFCKKLENVIFAPGSRLVSIGGYAFYSCSSLTTITIPASVKMNFNDPENPGIFGNPFIGCTKLATITVEAGNQDFSSEGGILYNKDKTGLIAYPTAPASFTIPASITNIGAYAFSNCENLASVIFPESVTSINQGAFSYCINLTGVNLATGLISIRYDAFAYCINLASVNLPESIFIILGNPFIGCTKLANITVEGIGSRYTAVGGALYEEHVKYDDGTPVTDENGEPVIEHFLVSYPAASGNITNLLATLAGIGSSAFQWTAITGITIPESIRTIGDNAFSYSNLMGITLPTSLKTIGARAFRECTGLIGDIALPDGLEIIDNEAFDYCININSIAIPESVTHVGQYVFQGWTPNQTIYVKGFSDEATADTAWGNYAWGSYYYLDGSSWRSGCEAKINYAL
jgi:hypothetical protein